MKNPALSSLLLALAPLTAAAQDTHTHADTTGIHHEQHLHGVTVTGGSRTHRTAGAVNSMKIGRKELFRCACCNLGESFVTNPAVDVTYSDAATGAKQIKLLGLSGTYVQMLVENMGEYRGLAVPYELDFVPGSWMKTISVSKGAASVKSGYESVTGQISVDYVKPDDEQRVEVNGYANSMDRYELNASANTTVARGLSTILFAHGEYAALGKDHNHDGFHDSPKRRQVNINNRWEYETEGYALNFGGAVVRDERDGGQDGVTQGYAQPYRTSTHTNHYNAYLKNALLLNEDHGTNLALTLNYSQNRQKSRYGWRLLDARDNNLDIRAIFETNIDGGHNISLGADYKQTHVLTAAYTQPLPTAGAAGDLPRTPAPSLSQDCTNREQGAYAQYTYEPSQKLTVMAGLRLDHSSYLDYGTLWTPRFHVKYAPTSHASIRLSAGKGYRALYPMADYSYLLASGRNLIIGALDKPEEAWNYGASLALNFPLGERLLKINAEYYYTDFRRQAVVDFDTDASAVHIAALDGSSRSHTVQADVSIDPTDWLSLTAAYRWNDVKSTYGGRLRDVPLTSKYKGLLTASAHTTDKLWTLDITLQLNGGGRLPDVADGKVGQERRFKAYEQLSAQLTREFKHFSVYIGAENLTGWTQPSPVLSGTNPWVTAFDATQIYGPLDGRMAYAGFRLTI